MSERSSGGGEGTAATWTIWECSACEQQVDTPFKECRHCGAPAVQTKAKTVVELSRCRELEAERDALAATLDTIGVHLAAGGPITETDRATLIASVEAALSSAGPGGQADDG